MSIGRILVAILVLLFVAAAICFGILLYQGKQKPPTTAPYVALGSSYAAGLGLGARSPGSPFICQRSINGYPQRVARMSGLMLTDMSCSGATMRHVLKGGQMFLGPQIDALGPATRLVTITAGGNDVSYVSDLTAMAYRRKGGVTGFIVSRLWAGPKAFEKRDFEQLENDMSATLREIRQRAPNALIIVVSYPTILPEAGTCAQIGIGAEQVAILRPVGDRLSAITRRAAEAAGVVLVDVSAAFRGHDACGREPWINGVSPASGAPFHPTMAGAEAVADAVMLEVRKHRI
jgi:lysophospholipase L1-like esterase